MKASYHQTFIGTLWLLLKPLFMVLAIVAAFYFRAGDVDIQTYTTTVVYGVVLWNFIIGSFRQVGRVISGSLQMFMGTTLPKEVIAFLPVVGQFIELLVGFVLILVVHLVFLTPVTFYGVGMFIASVILAAMIMYGLGLIFAIVSSYIKDLTYLTDQIIRLLFFTTPIFFLELPVGILTKTLLFNPFAMLLYVGRSGVYLADNIHMIVASLVIWAVVVTSVGLALFKRKISSVMDIM